MTNKAKLMICLMALSVALAGYISCVTASRIRWHFGWITAPAILPGLSFGLVTAGWLLHRGWIGRRKAIGFVIASAVAYFAAYWSAVYTMALCGGGMILSTVRLPLFHAGMIAGLVGMTLLTTSLAVVSADFRRKDWKTIILLGIAAGGALSLAGIGASTGDHAGTLANPGDRVFIFAWQLLVSGYIGILLWAEPASSAERQRSRFGHRTAVAVLALLVLSFSQAAIGYLRRDKDSSVASQTTSNNSNIRPSPPPQVANIEALGRVVLLHMQALDDEVAAISRGDDPEIVDAASKKATAMEQDVIRARDLLRAAAAAGNERAVAILNNVIKRNQERDEKFAVLNKKLDEEAKDLWTRTLVLADGRHVIINEDDGGVLCDQRSS